MPKIPIILKESLNWLSNHRYIFRLKPKDWNIEKEKIYQEWAKKQPNIKSLYP